MLIVPQREITHKDQLSAFEKLIHKLQALKFNKSQKEK